MNDSSPQPLPRINVLGVGVSAMNMSLAQKTIMAALERHQKGYICLAGVHGVSEAQADESLRLIFNRAFLCAPDGMPLAWIGRLKGFREMDRVYGPDLMLAVLELSEKNGWTQFLYGGANGTVEVLREQLVRWFPKLKIVGTFEPPFRPLNSDEQRSLKEMVRAAQPDIMWIGVSTPKQEKFMAEYLPQLDVTLMFGVGAAFDFHAGKVKQAPRWMQRAGLEWFFRLCCEPRRLWKRYLKNNPLFVARLFCQWSGLKKFPLSN